MCAAELTQTQFILQSGCDILQRFLQDSPFPAFESFSLQRYTPVRKHVLHRLKGEFDKRERCSLSLKLYA